MSNWYQDLHKGGFNGVSGWNTNPVSKQLFDSTCAHCGLTTYYGVFQDPSRHECVRLLQERDAYFEFMAKQEEKAEAYYAAIWAI